MGGTAARVFIYPCIPPRDYLGRLRVVVVVVVAVRVGAVVVGVAVVRGAVVVVADPHLLVGEGPEGAEGADDVVAVERAAPELRREARERRRDGGEAVAVEAEDAEVPEVGDARRDGVDGVVGELEDPEAREFAEARVRTWRGRGAVAVDGPRTCVSLGRSMPWATFKGSVPPRPKVPPRVLCRRGPWR